MLSTETVFLLTPEIALVAVAVAIYVAGAFSQSREVWSWIAAGGVIVAALALWKSSGHEYEAWQGSLVLDGLAWYVRWLALASGGLLVLLTSRPLSGPGTPEYVASLLLAVAGVMLAASAGNLVLLFVGLELVSIPTYVLLYLPRRDAASQEATAKYFFLSVLSSAILLYGFSFLYGAAGSTDLRVIHERLAGPAAEPGGLGGLAKLAGVLIFAGLGFKIAAVPFHFYAPDVYQGTTNPNAGLLSVVPKIAGFVALVRLVALTMPVEDESVGHLYAYTWRVAMALAVLTMTFGNVMALWQDNLRRLLAYSSIAHAGYMLIALAVALASGPGDSRGLSGLGALLLYLCVYIVATIGAFAALAYLGRRDRQVDGVEELAGLGRTRPLLAAMIGVFMFSLAGIPPLAGFWGKLYVFGSAFSIGVADGGAGSTGTWFIGLGVVGVLNAAIAAAYYLRIVAVMYFRLPLAAPRPGGGAGAWSATVLCAVLTVLIGVWPGPLFRESDRAGQSAVADSPGRTEAEAVQCATSGLRLAGGRSPDVEVGLTSWGEEP